MRLSLGLVLALCLAGLQFVAISFVVFSSYLSSEKVLLQHARDLMRDVGTNTIEHSRGFLQPARGAAELATRLAESDVVASDDFLALEKLLFQQLQVAPQFAGIFYGDTQGRFVYVMRSDGPAPFRSKFIARDGDTRDTDLIWRDGDYNTVVERRKDPQDTYDPRSRLWYRLASEKLHSIWTDPYIFFTSQSPGITAASPVFDDAGALKGVVGVDIDIDAISQFLSRLNIGKNGAALILNQNGDVIAHPDRDLIRTEAADGTYRFVGIDEIDDPVARAAFGPRAANGDVSVAREAFSQFEFGDESYVAALMPQISDLLPWTIAVYAPESDFTGQIRANQTQNIWIAVAISLITGAIGLALAKVIHKPVRAFAVRASLVSQGEVPASAPLPTTYRELERANETLVQAIAERKKSETEYGRIFDLASRGMAQIEAGTGRLLRVNAKLAAMLGYDEAEMLTLTVRDLSHPEDAISPVFTPERERETPEHRREKRYLRRDGSILWVNENVIVIREDADGRPQHAVITVEDISGRKSTEQRMRALNRDLSHSARVNVMGQMATGLAHELNQPLSAITQNMDTALYTLDHTDCDPAALRTLIEETDMQAHRAGDIIRALRGFVRKDAAEKVEFDFADLVDQTLDLVRPEAREHHISIRTDDLCGLDPVYGSRVQIAQVLVNLLRNAIEAIADSDVEARMIVVAAVERPKEIVISVSDTGPGCDPRLDLFEQFETSKDDGMGLGLSISRSIIEAHGGRLWHDTNAKKGAVFRFSLPAFLPRSMHNKQKDTADV